VEGLTTRREFIERSAAVAAALAVPWAAAACGSSNRKIVSAAIHPAIGIGRVGNSPDTFFFGPETPGGLPHSHGGFKDKNGAVARQAARFRIYGLDENGKPVQEVTAADAEITWHVAAANAKAAWYEPATPFDISGTAPAPRRNPDVKKRGDLIVAGQAGFHPGVGGTLGGTFLGQKVVLGEALTDGHGRLVVLPGVGRAYQHGSEPLTTFAGTNGWTDDVCDGLVRASVKLGDRTLEAAPAWLLTTPPNYGPAMATGLVTLYDAVRSMFVASGDLDGTPVSFADDIYPLFARMTDMQWVNAGFLESNGFGSKQDWTTKGNIDRLVADASLRRGLFKSFRNPAYYRSDQHALPEMYGDHINLPQEDVRQWLAVTPLQYQQLGAWANGRFTDDRDKAGREPPALEDLPVDEQPAALDRATLESCLGGAFHPGIEASWTMRIRTLWEEPFRLKVRSTTPDATNYGKTLGKDTVFKAGGMLDGVSPGDLTKWLGCPWHSDGASCRSGYQKRISTVLPTFWPARIPNQVLAEEDYKIVMDRSRTLNERSIAFHRRRDWERFIAKPTRPPTLKLMVSEWWKLGMILDRPGPGDANFPDRLKVESLVGFEKEPKHEYGPWLWVSQD
jgi:L-Lysine epsilon oxidase N-terminal/L-lysine epsilon oxidase C-terminal domain